MDAANVSARSSSSSKADKKKKRKHDDGQPQANGSINNSTLPNSSSTSGDAQAEADRLAKRARKDDKKNKKKHQNSQDANLDQSSSASSSSSPKKQKRGSTSTSAAAPAPTAQSISASAESAYRVVYPILNMPIAPVMWKRPLTAVQELFDTMVMRYVPQLGGILIAHEDHTFLSEAASIKADSAFATALVKVKCTIWAPAIGMRLEGKIVYSNTDVVSLLLNGIFNAAIPAAHLPPKQYEFVPNNHFNNNAHQQYSGGDSEHEIGAQSPGYWRRIGDKAPLGGTHGKVIFTCYGMTVANQLLFLRGSLLKDPFKPLSALESAMQGLAPGSSAAEAGAAVDARALQALFPNVNLDFSSKDGLESGARRSAVRAGGASGSQNATDTGDVTQSRRRVHWDDEEDEAEQQAGTLAGASSSAMDDDEDEGAELTYNPASASAAAGPAQVVSATTQLAQNPVHDRDEDGDVSMADVSMVSSVATTSSDVSVTRDNDDDDSDDDDDDDELDSDNDEAETDVKPASPSKAAAEKENGKHPGETKAERLARREARRERRRAREERKAARQAKRAARAAKKAEKGKKHKVKQEALEASVSGSSAS
ncbi:hypothetical protein OC845_000255 [Tilletia horrida]|nr:hypothetical protein OC845_000255 [Tilletia horrida]